MKVAYEDGFGARAVAAALDAGNRRIHLKDRPGRPGLEDLPRLLAGQDGSSLVVTEFERVKATLGSLREALGKEAVSDWGGDGRVVVGNYEKVGLYLRFRGPSDFGLVVMQPHRPENARAAAAIAGHFSPASMVQVTQSGDPAFAPDHVADRLPAPAAAQDNVAPFRRAS